MAIGRRKVGNAVYLGEYNSHREKGKVVADFVRYIGREDNEKSVMEPVRIIERVRPRGSTRSGDVDILWAMAQDLKISGTIDRMTLARSSISPGKVLTAWAINMVFDSGIAIQLESQIKTMDLLLAFRYTQREVDEGSLPASSGRNRAWP